MLSDLKDFKNMNKVYEIFEVSRRYIMFFMHNNKYLPLTGLLAYFRYLAVPYILKKQLCEIFYEMFHEIFQAKKSREILQH